MAVILNIETSTPLCSVALSNNGNVISQREIIEEKSHAARLTVFIEEILQESGQKIADLDAIAIGKGPGSYTGLRIGVSTAKGLAYGANRPLIAISTLKIMFKKIISNPGLLYQHELTINDTLFCPMIDARRMEVFTCLFNTKGELMETISAKVISKESYQHYLSQQKIVFMGTGMNKCREVLSHPNALFIDEIYPSAASLALLAEEDYQNNQFEDIAYFEPFYLKDFIATTPKKNLPN
jgi:tRNA threonylcarbamoyladenosine biosynthesis protein TsaB